MATLSDRTALGHREEGYAPIEDYAAIGDERTAALIAADGSVDWLCLPDLDSPSVFAGLLDAKRGGRFALGPASPHEIERRYLPDTNVLETMFTTSEGSAVVVDAMITGGLGTVLARRIEGLAGRVPMHWTLEPRFGYGARTGENGRRAGAHTLTGDELELTVQSWSAGTPEASEGSLDASFDVREGERALLALAVSEQAGPPLGSRDLIEGEFDATVERWRRWCANLHYDGPWRDEVVRSALTLKLLIHEPTGGIAAAATTSLPELIGGERNWDYRFAWIRDSSFVVDALLALGCEEDASRCFHWFAGAAERTHPKLSALYQLTGANSLRELALPLAGYRGSLPVRIGNGAAIQEQLGIYGDLMQTAHLIADHERSLDPEVAGRLAELAGTICQLWQQPDSGIWELRTAPVHLTSSKMLCSVGLERASWLAANGFIPATGSERWQAEATAIRSFVEQHCRTANGGCYTRAAGDERLDAAILIGLLMGYSGADHAGAEATVEAIRSELGAGGPLLYRYLVDDGIAGREGAFVPCSFWLAQALAELGRAEEAAELLEGMIGLANDLGLYAEEIDPEGGAFLGNFPQGLSHMALIGAALSLAGEDQPGAGRTGGPVNGRLGSP